MVECRHRCVIGESHTCTHMHRRFTYIQAKTGKGLQAATETRDLPQHLLSVKMRLKSGLFFSQLTKVFTSPKFCGIKWDTGVQIMVQIPCTPAVPALTLTY